MSTNKRLSSNLYTYTKWDRNKGLLGYKELPDGRLYSNLKYPTKLTKEDMPDWYMPGRFYKHHGFINSKGVVDIVYVPNYIFNHFHKDDILYISYKDKIQATPIKNYWGLDDIEYTGYDECFGGGQLVTFIQYVMKYSQDVDVKPIISEIYRKSHWMIKTFPADAEVTSGNRIEYLNKIFGGDPGVSGDPRSPGDKHRIR